MLACAHNSTKFKLLLNVGGGASDLCLCTVTTARLWAYYAHLGGSGGHAPPPPRKFWKFRFSESIIISDAIWQQFLD